MMTLKELREYLNALNLDEVQETAVIISETYHNDEHIIQEDELDFFSIGTCAHNGKHKPYLAIYTKAASDLILEED